MIAEGKIADRIAMPGDLFTDIEVTGRVDFVMKDGVSYKRQRLLAARVVGAGYQPDGGHRLS